MKNVVEEIVAREYAKLVPERPQFCGCPSCHDDVMVYVLNRLPTHYVSHRPGEVLSMFDAERDQELARVSVLLLEAFRRVEADPSAECERGSTR